MFRVRQAFPLFRHGGCESCFRTKFRFLRKCRWQRDDRAHAAEVEEIVLDGNRSRPVDTTRRRRSFMTAGLTHSS